jgi:DNA-binding transcriptional LysR family regulator
MDRLQSMKVFVKVAQHSGFAAAARELRMSTAAVSKHVAGLEAQIGARVFDRTTRRVGLTEVGRVYLERSLECLQALEDADASVGELAKDPRGLLRVTAPSDLAELVTPVIAEVMRAQPGIVVDLQLTNRVVDLVEEGVDVAVRVSSALDGRYVARPLARSRLLMFGTPQYLDEHGRPRRPADLESHRSLVFVEPRPMSEVVLTRGQRTVRVPLKVAMTSNMGAALHGAMLRGVGLAIEPSFLSHRDHQAGLIEQVLPDWSLNEVRMYAVYPHRRYLSPKVKVLVEALRAAIGDGTRDPWWPQADELRASPPGPYRSYTGKRSPKASRPPRARASSRTGAP